MRLDILVIEPNENVIKPIYKFLQSSCDKNTTIIYNRSPKHIEFNYSGKRYCIRLIKEKNILKSIDNLGIKSFTKYFILNHNEEEKIIKLKRNLNKDSKIISFNPVQEILKIFIKESCFNKNIYYKKDNEIKEKHLSLPEVDMILFIKKSSNDNIFNNYSLNKEDIEVKNLY